MSSVPSTPSATIARENPPENASRVHWPLMLSTALAVGLIMVILTNEEGQELAKGTLRALFSVLTTPFILEATSVFILSVALLTYNRWRREKDGDDWVYMVTQEQDDPTVPESITQRLQSTIVETKPDDSLLTSSNYSALEGYLELGMAAEALAELKKLPDTDDSLEFAQLKIRVLGSNLEIAKAQAVVSAVLDQHANSRPALARTALENAFWIHQHLKRPELGSQWVQMATALQPDIFAKMAISDPFSVLKPSASA